MLDIRCLKDFDIVHISAGRFILVRSTHFINSTLSGGKNVWGSNWDSEYDGAFVVLSVFFKVDKKYKKCSRLGVLG